MTRVTTTVLGLIAVYAAAPEETLYLFNGLLACWSR